MPPVAFEEYSLDKLKIPSLIAQKRTRPTGELRCAIAIGKCVYNKETGKRSIVGQKVVGVVEGNQEFGRILFKNQFIEQYPQLRDVTVLRKANGQYAYIKAKIEDEAYDNTCLKPGPKRYDPQQAVTKAKDCEFKEAGPFFLLDAISSEEKILPSVLEAFPKCVRYKLLDCAYSGVIDGELNYYLMEDICRNRMTYTQGKGMSTSALCRSIRAIRACERLTFWQQFNKLRILEIDPILGLRCVLIDSTSISTYSKLLAQAKWGNNKDHEDLKQVNLMLVTDTGGMPRMHFFHAGNINDSSAFKGDAQDVQNVLWANGIESLGEDADKHFSFVWEFDRGFNITSNMCSICEAGNHFLGCLSVSNKIASDALLYACQHNIRFKGQTFTGHSGLRHLALPEELCATITTSDGKVHTVYTHVYYDDKSYAKNVMELNDKADTIMIFRRQNSYSNLSNDLKKLDKKINLVKKIELENGDVTYEVNCDAIQTYAHDESMWVIITTLGNLSGLDVWESYRKRNNVEVAFRTFKDLNFSRLYAQDTQALEGRGFVAILTTMEQIGLLNRCYDALGGKYGVNLTPQMIKFLRKPKKLLELMKSIRARVTHDGRVIVQHVGGLERSLFLALGLTPPGGKVSSSKEEAEVYAYSPNAPEGYTITGAIEDGLTSIRNRQIIHA